MGLNCSVNSFASKTDLAADPSCVADLEDFQDEGGLRTGISLTAVQTPMTFWCSAEVNGKGYKRRMALEHVSAERNVDDDKVWESEDGLTEGLDLSNLGMWKWCPWGQLLYPMPS